MKKRKVEHYKKLMNAQKLIKMQNEAELASSYRSIVNIKEENNYLLLLLQGKEKAEFIGPVLTSHRLGSNRIKEEQLEIRINDSVKGLAESSRRYELMKDRAKQMRDEEERNRLAIMIQEYVASHNS